ncbi:MAG: hypothetical protein LAT55_10740 [Opitutales bacterium]|nr:hypothetical protein [Opitutales bacterium]
MKRFLYQTSLFTAFSLFFTGTASFLSGQSQYWTPPPWEAINEESRGNFSNQPQPLRLVAPRNGFATGQIVLRGGRVDSARMGNFEGPGNANIPSDLTEIRFAAKESPDFPVSHENFDLLLDAPPSTNLGSNTLQPVWLRVQVPPSARPGAYRGTLRIGTTQVPVTLEVADYLLPDPLDWVAWKHLVLSFEATAWTYGHDLWSEDHFAKMVPSLRKLKALGNNVVHIPVQGSTFYGNDHGMLVFREERGVIRPDFHFVDQFLDLYDQHVGEPRVLWLYMWELRQGDAHQERDDREVRVSMVSGSGNTLREGTLPLFGLGEADEVWDELITGMRERISQRGWDPDVLMVGTLGDARDRPSPQTLAFFSERNVPWVVFSHWRGDPTHADRELDLPMGEGTAPVGLAEFPYRVLPSDSAPSTLGGGWQEQYTVPWLTTSRGVASYDAPPVSFRLLSDSSVSSQDRFPSIGLGRIGLDGWRTLRPGDDREARFPILHIRRNGWFRLWRHNPSSIVAPGPNGAIPTVRFEMLREGAQEAEARILLERALASGSLSSERRREIEEFLPDWIGQRYYVGGSRSYTPDTTENWYDLIARLYELAGQAARDTDLVAQVDAPADAVRLFRGENARHWTSADGRSIEAEFVRYDSHGVTLLLPNNQTATLPLERLSAADREWIREESGFRLWRSRDGRELEARMLALEGNQLTIERLDGIQFQVDISNLSDADQAWARSQ